MSATQSLQKTKDKEMAHFPRRPFSDLTIAKILQVEYGPQMVPCDQVHDSAHVIEGQDKRGLTGSIRLNP
jgi:hypothetical protein